MNEHLAAALERTGCEAYVFDAGDELELEGTFTLPQLEAIVEAMHAAQPKPVRKPPPAGSAGIGPFATSSPWPKGAPR